MNFTTFALIIALLVNISAIILNILMIKKIMEANKSEEIKEKIDNNYINSLEFNTLLDDMIRPLLGKYSNQEIAKSIVHTLTSNNTLKKYNISPNIMKDYILDLLLNYNNNYTSTLEVDLERHNPSTDYNKNFMDIDELYTKKSVSGSSSNSNINEVNLSNTLNNFYKD